MKDKLPFIVSGILAICFGLFMILNPALVVNVAAFLFSLMLVIRGFVSLRGSFRFNSALKKMELTAGMDEVRKTMVTRTLVSFGVGVLALMISVISLINHSDGIMKASIYVIALGFLLNGILGMIENRKFKVYGEVFDAFADKAFINIIIALVLFVFPFLIGSVVIFILGGLVILMGVGSLLFGIKAKRVVVQEVNEVEFTEAKED